MVKIDIAMPAICYECKLNVPIMTRLGGFKTYCAFTKDYTDSEKKNENCPLKLAFVKNQL